jgi:hypothetical protein
MRYPIKKRWVYLRDILVKMEQLEKSILKQDKKAKKHEEEIQLIFNALKQLLNPPLEPRKPIGFRVSSKKTE